MNVTKGVGLKSLRVNGLSQPFGDVYLLHLISQRDSKLWTNIFFVFIIDD